MPPVFKILTRQQWTEAQIAGSFSGSPDDLRDGYIHLSTAEQVAGTLEKHFAGTPGLLLAEIDSDGIAPGLKWERSRNDQLFPHLYGDLPVSSVISVRELPESGFRPTSAT